MRLARRRPPGLRIGAIVLVVWLVIGAIAAGQRGYYKGEPDDCASVATILVTILAGPLNYLGANPKVTCDLPEPSE